MAYRYRQREQESFDLFMGIVWALIIIFGGGYLILSKVDFGGVESTTYLGHDEQVENGSVIYTGQ